MATFNKFQGFVGYLGLAAITTMDKRMRAPRRIVRGPDGRAIGVQVDVDGPAQTVQ